MTTATVASSADAALFTDAAAWADMDRWHHEVARIRRESPVPRCEPPGYTPFWVLTATPTCSRSPATTRTG
ncbi:MAG: hypothetical protein U5R31_08985 [Acidimicrobiia bacterium]|nr:hypothetical protein [Acidimicrobiia bacterium]